MDHRYYYDALAYAGPERRDRARRRTREIAAAGAVAAILAAAGQALGIVEGQAVVLSCTVAALLSVALHRPVVRLLRSEPALPRTAGQIEPAL